MRAQATPTALERNARIRILFRLGTLSRHVRQGGGTLGAQEGEMKRTILLLAGLGLAMPCAAAPSAALKCGANMDRIWVYSDLTTLDVGARLKCGTSVDVVGLEKGYVKVRTSDGTEGYVPAESVPASEMAVLTAAAAPAAPVPTPASAARANMQTASPTSSVVAQAAAAPAPLVVTVTAVARPTPQPAPVPPAPVVTPVTQLPPAAPAGELSKAAPAKVPATAQPPAPAVAAPRQAAATRPEVEIVAVSTPQAAQAHTVPATHQAAATQPEVEIVAVSAPPARRADAPPTPRPLAHEAATYVIEPVSRPALVEAAPVATVVRAADVAPVTKRPLIGSNSSRTGYSDDDENTGNIQASLESDMSSCSVYFSAYGVTPMQYKYIAGDMRKRFPGVCPAPEPSQVDYVVILTHDMDYFTSTLPDPIHTDRNGFSDWSPVTAVDSTTIPASELDKARREYTWVFRVHRGTFDPSNFTERRHPQFSKTESNNHASSKTIEDAMEFIAQTGPSQ
jgi:hypothetical protein